MAVKKIRCRRGGGRCDLLPPWWKYLPRGGRAAGGSRTRGEAAPPRDSPWVNLDSAQVSGRVAHGQHPTHGTGWQSAPKSHHAKRLRNGGRNGPQWLPPDALQASGDGSGQIQVSHRSAPKQAHRLK